MKTLKLTLLATIVAFAFATVASADGITEKPKAGKVINISLTNAMSMPGLVTAMYAQIKSDELLTGGSHYVYTAVVHYNGATYRITGTLLQWIRFFQLQGTPPVNFREKTVVSDIT
jgi:hypothetical protein